MFDLIKDLGSIGWIVIFFYIWGVIWPESREKFMGLFLTSLKWVGTSPRRKKIEQDLQGTLNTYVKKIEKQAFEQKVLPYGLKIEWQKESEPDVYLKEGEVIIRLGYSLDQNRNFIEALTLYLHEAFLPEIRPYMNKITFNAIKYTLTFDIIQKEGKEARRYFILNYFKPFVNQDQDSRIICDKLDNLRKKGYFRAILLPVLSDSGELLIKGIPRPDIEEEIDAFIDFLCDIAEKESYERDRGEEPPLTFLNPHIKVSVVLVARAEVPLIRHLQRAKKCFQEGSNIVFLMGRGAHIDDVKWVSKKIKEEQIFKQINDFSRFDMELFEESKFKKVDTICAMFRK